MNGIRYLADTNAIIYLLNGNDCMKPFLSEQLYVSIITELELLSFSDITEQEEINIRSFLAECCILSLDDSISERTISVRKKYKMKLPDAIIASTAIENGLKLITADKGFEKIKELEIAILDPAM